MLQQFSMVMPNICRYEIDDSTTDKLFISLVCCDLKELKLASSLLYDFITLLTLCFSNENNIYQKKIHDRIINIFMYMNLIWFLFGLCIRIFE